MDGKVIRINRIINPIIKKALMADISSLSEEHYNEESIRKLVYCDGLILSPSQIEKLFHVFLGRSAPALIFKFRWKGLSPLSLPSFVENGLFIGASAMMGTFFVGHERDEEEAENLEIISLFARECEKLDLPLIIECIPFGERITKENFSKCVELATRVSAEAGADVIVVPYVELPFIRRIVDGVGVPILMNDMKTPFGSSIENLETALNNGVSGFLIGEETLRKKDLVKLLYDLVHGRGSI